MDLCVDWLLCALLSVMPNLHPWHIFGVQKSKLDVHCSLNLANHKSISSHISHRCVCVWYWHCTIPWLAAPSLYPYLRAEEFCTPQNLYIPAHLKQARSAQVCYEFHVNWHPLTSAECIMSQNSGMISPNWHCVYFWTNLIKRFNLCSRIAPSAGTGRPCPACASEQDIFSSLIVT